MKPKIKPEIENVLLPLFYLQHLAESSPECKRIIGLLPFFNRFEDPWKEVKNFKEMAQIMMTVPEYKFSKLLSREEYINKSTVAIENIKSSYLSDPKNKLSEEDKEYIISGLNRFYAETEFSLVPFYNQFQATKDDRNAFICLSTWHLITFIFNLFYLMIEERNRIKNKIEESNIELKNAYQIVKDVETEDPNIALIKEMHAKLEIEEAETENAVAELNDKISNEQFDLIGQYFKLDLSAQSELYNSQLFGNLSMFKVFEDDLKLDNTALRSRYILLIYEQVDKIFEKLTEHAKCNIAGYICLNFGILDEADWHPATSTYASLTSFLRERVRGILRSVTGKSQNGN